MHWWGADESNATSLCNISEFLFLVQWKVFITFKHRCYLFLYETCSRLLVFEGLIADFKLGCVNFLVIICSLIEWCSLYKWWSLLISFLGYTNCLCLIQKFSFRSSLFQRSCQEIKNSMKSNKIEKLVFS